ncbi:MAG: FKBP-type peptidyl-prolyl cis-trans isomerase [Vibrionaceae bacterium]
MIKKYMIVKLEMTTTYDDGTLCYTTKSGAPMEYVHGTGHLLAALESVLEGKKVGDAIDVVLEPHEAYGQHDPSLVQRISKAHFSHIPDFKAGIGLNMTINNVDSPVFVAEVYDDEVLIDANHPLVEQRLHFSGVVKAIREPTAAEMAEFKKLAV